MAPRFYHWQLEQPVAESWAERKRHAGNILGDEAFDRLMTDEGAENKAIEAPQDAAVGTAPGQGKLF